jgi:hypothetical protein
MPNLNATPTPVTPPRVPLIDPRTGLIDRAWYMFFLSMFNAASLVYGGDLTPSAESLIASYDAALRALAQNVDTQPAPVDLGAELMALRQEVETAPRTELGTMAFLNSPLAVAFGGTGQTSFTDGQLLIGNSTGNTLTKATLTAGANVTITNGAGSITIDAASVTGASGTFITANTPAKTVTVVNGIITSIV